MKAIYVGRARTGVMKTPEFNKPGVFYSRASKKYVVVMKRDANAKNGPRTAFQVVAQFNNKPDADYHYSNLIK